MVVLWTIRKSSVLFCTQEYTVDIESSRAIIPLQTIINKWHYFNIKVFMVSRFFNNTAVWTPPPLPSPPCVFTALLRHALHHVEDHSKK